MKKTILSIIFMISLSSVCFATEQGEGRGDIYGTQNTVIDVDGNVGIGTTSPSEKLEVVGDVLVAGGIQQVQAYIREEQNPNTASGTFTTGDWRTRVLNAIESEYDPNNEISLSSNQVTLSTGTWEVWARCPAYRVQRHKAVLNNVTDGGPVLIGSSAFAYGTGGGTDSIIQGVFTITSAKAFSLIHQCETTYADKGLGVESNFGVQEIYSEIWIKKLSD